jgi:hypothetical protein
MEVLSPRYGGIISGYEVIVSGIWRYNLRVMEVESQGYGGIVSVIWSYSLLDME